MNNTLNTNESNLLDQTGKSENINVIQPNKLTQEEQEIGLYIESQDDLTIKI